MCLQEELPDDLLKLDCHGATGACSAGDGDLDVAAVRKLQEAHAHGDVVGEADEHDLFWLGEPLDSCCRLRTGRASLLGISSRSMAGTFRLRRGRRRLEARDREEAWRIGAACPKAV